MAVETRGRAGGGGNDEVVATDELPSGPALPIAVASEGRVTGESCRNGSGGRAEWGSEGWGGGGTRRTDAGGGPPATEETAIAEVGGMGGKEMGVGTAWGQEIGSNRATWLPAPPSGRTSRGYATVNGVAPPMASFRVGAGPGLAPLPRPVPALALERTRNEKVGG